MSLTRAGPGVPPGTSGGCSVASARPAAPALSCNRCDKPLATTCFLCACDCIFCEECTYSHFESSSKCPTCGRTLRENDFTELVVADNNGTDVSKTSMQALFSKKSRHGNLQYSDICQSLIQQIDVSKQNTKFLLKQLLVRSHKAGSRSMAVSRAHEALKVENTHLKQLNSSQRLQYEQTINDLQNKLKAREGTISELNGMLAKFRSYHGGSGRSVGSGRGGGGAHMVPNSSAASLASGRTSGGPEPPLRGLMAQREASKQAQQHAMAGVKRGPFMNSMGRTRSPAANEFRPFSSSNGSGGHSIGSSATGIRDLRASTGYHFTGVPAQNLNKRRRGNTPTSHGTSTPRISMSPNTAFALNQGPHSGPHSRNIFQGQR